MTLDVEPIRAADARLGNLDDEWKDFPLVFHDRHALLAEVDKLRDEITDRANVEADLRAQLAETKAAVELPSFDEIADEVERRRRQYGTTPDRPVAPWETQ